MGFRNIEFVIDLNERFVGGVTRDTEPIGKPWTEEDYQALADQMNLIATEIAKGLPFGIERAHVVGIDSAIRGLLSKERMIFPECRVLDGRTSTPMNREEHFCLSNLGVMNWEQARNKLFKEL